MAQPTVGTIFETRQAQQSLLVWAGIDKPYLEYIKEYWKNTLFGTQTAEIDFDSFWTRSLHNGVFQPTAAGSYQSILMGGTMATIAQPVVAKVEEVKADKKQAETKDAKKEEMPKAETETKEEVAPTSVGISTDVAAIGEQIKKRYKKASEGELQLVIYEPVLMGWGVQANNPILQDTPDPISKVCWGNYVAVSQKFAQQNNLKTAEGRSDLVTIKVGDQEMTLPVLVQPGQASNVIALALGYGRAAEKAGKVAGEAAGMNAFVMLGVKDNSLEYIQLAGVSVSPANDWTKIAQTQTHQTFMGRQTIIQETILSEYQKNQQSGRYMPMVAMGGKKAKPNDLSLWDIGTDGYKKPKEARNEYEKTLWKNRHPDLADKHPYSDHHWGLAIDLNSCTGCSACLVACHLENNVPVVGKTEIARRRDMHWIRIDRYYSSNGAPKDYSELEKAADDPEVVFQPMMCQHCNNAPCETVCPVAATTHSSEGLNQMAYNRCIGTKYCANNCPYKVRRFNWFKYFKNDEFNYHMNNDLGRMVLNPDVTVRSRGVIEKCSMCIQRIQAGKLKAKIENRRPVDGEINTACASACPSNAIVFGDLNDMQSGISTLLDHEVEKGRAYNVLEEIATKPNVWYLTKVRNKDKEEKNS